MKSEGKIALLDVAKATPDEHDKDFNVALESTKEESVSDCPIVAICRNYQPPTTNTPIRPQSDWPHSPSPPYCCNSSTWATSLTARTQS